MAGCALSIHTLLYSRNSDKTWTITYDANGGQFSDGTTQHEVTYTGHPATTTKYSHTANIDDSGNANGAYANNLSTTDTVTIPGAKQLTIDVWYSTESTNYDWLAIYPEGVTPSGSNYSSASISGGKLGGGKSATKDGATHSKFTVDGNTAQFYFKSDSSGSYYGYYAVVTDASVPVAVQNSYEKPSSMDDKEIIGWYKDATCTEEVYDPSTLGENATVYAKYENVAEGTWGTCAWRIGTSGTLYIGAGTGADTNLRSPWTEYASNISSVKTLGTVVLPSNSSGLFMGCSSLKTLDLSGFDASNVTNMSCMFYGCSSLESLGLSGFDTSNVNDMDQMFYGCSSLKSLDLSGFDTSNASNLANMFAGCSSLKTLDLSSFETSKVTDMPDMFGGCSSLKTLDLSGFDTAKVNNMAYMFWDCSSLESLDLSGFDTSQVKYMNYMFAKCSSLESLDLSGFVTSMATDTDYMFYGCSGLKRLVMSDKMSQLTRTELPEISKTDLYTGKWMYIGDSSIKPLSSSDLMSKYPSDEAPAGIWEWERTKSVKVSFDANSGSGSMADYTSAGDFIAVPDNGFYYLNHAFTGWNTKADGTGTTAQPGDIFDAGSNADSDGRLTLYAQWKESDNKAQVTNGHFTVTIKAGQMITIKNLPGGATYTVHEHNRAGWVLKSAENATGKIPALGTAQSVFTNTYNPNATSVDISAAKTLDGKTPKDGAYSFTMTANTVGAPMPAGVTGTSTTASNVGTLVDFGHIVFERPGTYFYTLKETAGTDSTISYDAHTIKARVDVSDPTGTGALAARVTYSPDDAFANTTKPGSITVTKDVEGTNSSFGTFNFDLTLVDSNGNAVSGTYGGVSFADGKGSFTLNAGESKKLDGIPAGTRYKVEETNIPGGYSLVGAENAEGVVAAAKDSAVAITNAYYLEPAIFSIHAKKILNPRV